MVSVTPDGASGNGWSTEPSMNADGRFVAFRSGASNLVANDTNDSDDIFVRDRQAGTTTRISVTSDGQERQGFSRLPRITPDGRFVVFESDAALVADDTCASTLPCTDVYVHDRQTGATTRVSVSSAGAQGDGQSTEPSISGDGRFVVFASTSTNLVPGDTNGQGDAFLHDRQTGTTTRVSGQPLFGSNQRVRISSNGKIVLFSGTVPAQDLPNPELCFDAAQCRLIFLHDRDANTTTLLSHLLVSARRDGWLTTQMLVDAVSEDGRILAITEFAGKADPSLPRAATRTLVHDRATGHTKIGATWSPLPISSVVLDMTPDGRALLTNPRVVSDRLAGFDESVEPISILHPTGFGALAADARLVAFTASVRFDHPSVSQVFLHDRDGDADGIPSAWETRFGLNPTSATDGAADSDGDGVTNLQEYQRGSHPTQTVARYFAEGAANAFFTTRLAVVNPHDVPVTAVFRFLGQTGTTSALIQSIAPRTRATIPLSQYDGTPENNFSTIVESDRALVVDRTMFWDATGYGSHTETSIPAPSTTWHLAEGATHGSFDLFYLLQNPNAVEAHVTIRYLRLAPLTPIEKTYTVRPNSRETVYVDVEDPDLANAELSAEITADQPIVVERAMYSTRPGQPPFAAGHAGAGVTAPASRWFLAEGATGSFFDLFVLVSNPNTTEAQLKVTYLRTDGEPFSKTYSVGARNRLTINVANEDPRLVQAEVSTIVESTNGQPVVVERAMWWPKFDWYEAHASVGATSTATRWAIADTHGDTFILIANTSPTAGRATLTLLPSGQEPFQHTVDLPANSRVTIPASALVVDQFGSSFAFGAIVESDGVDIVVERASYATIGGVHWSAGTAALATPLPLVP